MTAIADRNGTNAGISTASTPINQKKLIPNTRRGSNKAKGGQPGHARHVLEGFDVEIHVVKRRYEYPIYECIDCGVEVRLQIDSKLKETNQYGNRIQAVALSLMVTGNVAINKVRMYNRNDFWSNESERRIYLQTLQESNHKFGGIYKKFEKADDTACTPLLG